MKEEVRASLADQFQHWTDKTSGEKATLMIQAGFVLLATLAYLQKQLGDEPDA